MDLNEQKDTSYSEVSEESEDEEIKIKEQKDEEPKNEEEQDYDDVASTSSCYQGLTEEYFETELPLYDCEKLQEDTAFLLNATGDLNWF